MRHMPLAGYSQADQSTCCTSCHIYQRGFAVDLDALESVRQEFEQSVINLVITRGTGT